MTIVGALDEATIARFHAGYAVHPAGCWVWRRPDRGGYGRFRISGRGPSIVRLGAHVLSLLLAGGEVPEGHEVDHLCRNRACVNPEHLEAVTHRENVKRSTSPLAEQIDKTHCNRGHSLDGAYVDAKGTRHCRPCSVIAKREYRRRKREAA